VHAVCESEEELTYLYTIPTVPTAAGSAIFWISAITDIATTGAELERNSGNFLRLIILLEAHQRRAACIDLAAY
jgi:hypothetical protein